MNSLLALVSLVAVSSIVVFALLRAESLVLAPPSPRPIWQGEHAVIRVGRRIRTFLALAPLFFGWVSWMAFVHTSPRGHVAGRVVVGIGVVALATYGAVQSFVAFRVGPVGLTRVGLLTPTAIHWPEVRAIELTSGPWVRAAPFMRIVVSSTGDRIDLPLTMAGIAAFGAFAVERLPPQTFDGLAAEVRTLLQDLAAHAAAPRA